MHQSSFLPSTLLLAIASRFSRLCLPALVVAMGAPAHATVWQEIRLPGVAPSNQPQSLAIVTPQTLPGQRAIFEITPERRALLNTIRYAEGTWANGEDVGYRIMFGGSLMASLDRHPDRVNRTVGYASAAAGAYQFMPFTWSMATRALGITGFGPQVQDQAAIFLIQRRGALALADRGTLTPELAAKLAPEWASFPTLAGRSFYGQPVKRYAQLRAFYEANLASLRAIENVRPDIAQAAPPVQPACTGESLSCALQETSAGR
jgi:lysozyme